MIKINNKAMFVICVIFVVLLQSSSVSARNEQKLVCGNLTLGSISVSRINLAVKEIDIEIHLLSIYVNGSFSMTVWYPSRGGGIFSEEDAPIKDSPPWHQFNMTEWPIRSLSIKTIPLEINIFPFESYEAEIIFGFNTTKINPNIQFDPWLSSDLAQEGRWIVTARFGNTSNVSLKLRGNEELIKYRGLKWFLSLFITLGHPAPYILKMLIPTWGPLVFIILMLFLQFKVTRLRLDRSDHVVMFIGVAVFALGQALTIRELTPPELTLPEAATFILTIVYVMILFYVIKRGFYLHEMTPKGTACTRLF